eukprot:c20200_g1_i3.p2 GENE.c20200_g1_i3~~c20200_g1_i3.p2  ORF type:complete len:102 (+),score=6.49 c20200_g1_i3:336-641(+)
MRTRDVQNTAVIIEDAPGLPFLPRFRSSLCARFLVLEFDRVLNAKTQAGLGWALIGLFRRLRRLGIVQTTCALLQYSKIATTLCPGVGRRKVSVVKFKPEM